MRTVWKSGAATALLAAGIAVSAPAQAGLFVVPGTSNANTDNVISSSTCASHIDGPASLIEGCLNANHNDLVTFSVPAAQSIIFAAGGQAEVREASNGAYGPVTIAMPGHTFGKIQLSLDIPPGAVGQVTFSSNLDGPIGPFTLTDSGENKFTLYTTDPSLPGFPTGDWSSITITTYTCTANFADCAVAPLLHDTKQVRIGFVDGLLNVPEPASLALLGTALLGFGTIVRRRRGTTPA